MDEDDQEALGLACLADKLQEMQDLLGDRADRKRPKVDTPKLYLVTAVAEDYLHKRTLGAEARGGKPGRSRIPKKKERPFLPLALPLSLLPPPARRTTLCPS